MALHAKESFISEHDLLADENLEWDDIFNDVLSTPLALRDTTLRLLSENLDIFNNLWKYDTS